MSLPRRNIIFFTFFSLTLDGHDLKGRLIAEWSVCATNRRCRLVAQTSALLRGNFEFLL